MIDLEKSKKWINEADAILVTAGNVWGQHEGLDLFDEASFKTKYQSFFTDKVDCLADALSVNLSWEKRWQFWRKLIQTYSINYQPSSEMQALKQILTGKNYEIATTTFAHFFENASFDQKRILDLGGDWTQMQCSSGLNHGVLPVDLTTFKVPTCPDCASPMQIRIPLDANFYPDEDANTHFRWFLTKNQTKKVVVLQLGVDQTTPQLFAPIINLCQQFTTWKFLSIDPIKSALPSALKDRAFIDADLLTKLQ